MFEIILLLFIISKVGKVEIKEAKLVQKYPQLCQLCLGFKLFQFMRKNISQLCQLCLDLNDAKLVQKYQQLCQLCHGFKHRELKSNFSPLWFKLFQFMRKNISQLCKLCLCLKEAKLVQKYHQLCQLCLVSKLVQFKRKKISQLCQLCLL